jgi:hypothetical protein
MKPNAALGVSCRNHLQLFGFTGWGQPTKRRQMDKCGREDAASGAPPNQVRLDKGSTRPWPNGTPPTGAEP